MKALPSGTILADKYKIESLLGKGGFGFVYKAHNVILDIDVAIKELCPRSCCERDENGIDIKIPSKDSYLLYENYEKNFSQEAMFLTRLRQHPNLVTTYDYFMDNNTWYHVIELLNGITLREYMYMREKAITETEAIFIMTEILKALSCLHQQNIIHMDVSSKNIIITNDGSIKLIDLGASIILNKQGKRPIIINGQYTPLEQYIINDNNIGPWTDIYSLGVVMYEILTKKKVPLSLDRMINDTLISPIKINRSISRKFNNIIMKMLSLDNKKRFQNTREIIDIIFDENISSKHILKIIFIIIIGTLMTILCIILIFLRR